MCESPMLYIEQLEPGSKNECDRRRGQEEAPQTERVVQTDPGKWKRRDERNWGKYRYITNELERARTRASNNDVMQRKGQVRLDLTTWFCEVLAGRWR
ncbi:hypothetical protein FA15DRAFT_245540 [Coprinopsis marcescibilis]|uniref:Uncharacterized protein n=1 Tax=Coprinopsis marcescibilis TaxID=230819 RepID=A0A5C3L2I2_COPMA|nr:hypothetical protein FA15DRAFT_245540 [Coprinopsis marcescibilis]